jgi:hypothetical protein
MSTMDAAALRAEVDSVPLWYHTIDVGHGVSTPGWFDLRPIVEGMPWPDVKGKRQAARDSARRCFCARVPIVRRAAAGAGRVTHFGEGTEIGAVTTAVFQGPDQPRPG